MTETNARKRILAAAGRVLARDGASQMTLNAVAREAEVSKGGLLYHFASKDAIIQGMTVDVIEEFEQLLASQPLDGRPGQFARAFIEASLAYSQEDLTVMAGGLAAAAHQPELLAPLRAAILSWQERLEADGLSPVSASLIRLATDGLWFGDVLHLPTPQGAQRDEFRQRLLELTRV